MNSFNKILIQKSIKVNSKLCVGLDIDSSRLPDNFDKTINGLKSFLYSVIDCTTDICLAYKINLAFYERYGSSGYKLMEDIVDYIGDKNITIADGKRGDIGNTTSKYAKSLFNQIGFDSVTVSPYMGRDSIEPFIDDPLKGAFILCLTSNKSASDIQFIEHDGKTIYESIATLVKELNCNKNLGLVVGATQKERMMSVREASGDMPWLIPGIGAQGGDLESSVEISCSNSSIGVINVSRGILYYGNCSEDDIREAAKFYNNKINLINVN